MESGISLNRRALWAGIAVIGVLSAGSPKPLLAQDALHTDIGDIDKSTDADIFPKKRPYSPYAGRNFPMQPLYKFGLVGSMDSHTSLATADDDNFGGNRSSSEPSAGRTMHSFMQNPKIGVSIMGWEQTASGYAAVWAEENTRESIFDAMKRRETYATTGPRT